MTQIQTCITPLLVTRYFLTQTDRILRSGVLDDGILCKGLDLSFVRLYCLGALTALLDRLCSSAIPSALDGPALAAAEAIASTLPMNQHRQCGVQWLGLHALTWQDVAAKWLAGLCSWLCCFLRLSCQKITQRRNIQLIGRGCNDHACLLHLIQHLMAHRSEEILQTWATPSASARTLFECLHGQNAKVDLSAPKEKGTRHLSFGLESLMAATLFQ